MPRSDESTRSSSGSGVGGGGGGSRGRSGGGGGTAGGSGSGGGGGDDASGGGYWRGRRSGCRCNGAGVQVTKPAITIMTTRLLPRMADPMPLALSAAQRPQTCDRTTHPRALVLGSRERGTRLIAKNNTQHEERCERRAAGWRVPAEPTMLRLKVTNSPAAAAGPRILGFSRSVA